MMRKLILSIEEYKRLAGSKVLCMVSSLITINSELFLFKILWKYNNIYPQKGTDPECTIR